MKYIESLGLKKICHETYETISECMQKMSEFF